MDISALINTAPKFHWIEYILLLAGLLVLIVGYSHQLMHRGQFALIGSRRELRIYANFVRLQMICSLAFIVCMVPAIGVGIWNGLATLLYALPVYFLYWCGGKAMKPIEANLKNTRSHDPDMQECIDKMVYYWDKKAFPTFRI